MSFNLDFFGWVCVVDSNLPNYEEISTSIESRGGEVRKALSNTVTHLICNPNRSSQDALRAKKAESIGVSVLSPDEVLFSSPLKKRKKKMDLGSLSSRVFPEFAMILDKKNEPRLYEFLKKGDICIALLSSNLANSLTSTSTFSSFSAICLLRKHISLFQSWVIPNDLVTRQIVKALFFSCSTQHICFDSKTTLKAIYQRFFPVQDLQVSLALQYSGIPPKDPKIARWLLSSSEKEITFGDLVRQYRGYLPKSPSFLQPAFEMKEIYLAMFQCLEISAAIDDELRRCDLFEVYFFQELPIIPILTMMELVGVPFDAQQIPSIQTKLENICESLAKQTNSIEGIKDVLITSSKQVAGALFSVNQSVNEEVLLSLLATDVSPPHLKIPLKEAQGFAHLVLTHRKFAKLLNTYVKPLLRLSVKLNLPTNTDVRVIRSKWLQTGTATGRLSCREPNLQTLPKKSHFQEDEKEGISLRSLIRCPLDSFNQGENSYYFILSDFSQIELRVLADLSGDPDLIASFSSPQVDFFDELSQKWSISFEGTSLEKRGLIKRLCYGFLYGQGTRRMAQQLGKTQKETLKLTQQFQNKYPAITEYRTRVLRDCRKTGEIRTKFGRRRLLPDITSNIPNCVAEAERQAFNSVIQGTAADIMKRSMVRLHSRLCQRGLSATIVLQIHDEVILLANHSEVEDVKYLVQLSMEEKSLCVPTPVVIRIGVSLAEEDLLDYDTWERSQYSSC